MKYGMRIWYAKDNHSYMCHIMCKGIFRFELILSSYSQNVNFSGIAPYFTFSQKS